MCFFIYFVGLVINSMFILLEFGIMFLYLYLSKFLEVYVRIKMSRIY